MSQDNFVNRTNARIGDGYGKVIEEIAAKKVCPFCEHELHNHHKRPIDTRTYWHVTENMYPYKLSREHLLFIHRTHIVHASEISPEAWIELQEIVREVTAARKIVGGTLMMRFGETRYTGASVTHLHAHLVQSNPDSPEYEATKGLLTRIG